MQLAWRASYFHLMPLETRVHLFQPQSPRGFSIGTIIIIYLIMRGSYQAMRKTCIPTLGSPMQKAPYDQRHNGNEA